LPDRPVNGTGRSCGDYKCLRVFGQITMGRAALPTNHKRREMMHIDRIAGGATMESRRRLGLVSGGSDAVVGQERSSMSDRARALQEFERVWSPAGLDEIRRITGLALRHSTHVVGGHISCIEAVATTPNGRWVLTGSRDCMRSCGISRRDAVCRHSRGTQEV